MIRLIYKLFYNLDWYLSSTLTKAVIKRMDVHFGPGFRSFHFPIIKRSSNAKIYIGNDLTLINHNRANAIGISHPCIIVAAKGASINIGNNCGFSGVVINALGNIYIGNYVLIGANTQIFDNDFHPLEWQNRHDLSRKPDSFKPVKIEDDVFIGTNAIILKGVTIGRGAIIGAGAVVTKNIEPFTIYAGNPAKKIGEAPK